MTAAARLDEITLAHGGSTVRLRPCLRAASYFAREGFADLPRRIADFHLGTIRNLIDATATDRQEARAFLAALDAAPVKGVAGAITAPLLALIAGFIPAPDEDAKPAKGGKPMPWPAVYRELFRTATGWLGWTPEAAWQATPTEINEAFAGHIAKLKAIHGAPEKEADKQPNIYSAEQLRQIDEEGLDPEFDREGLQRLKAKIARKR
jgi:hypothetical protein